MKFLVIENILICVIFDELFISINQALEGVVVVGTLE